MENTLLHAQKLAILSRLIKADQLTLEEALLLLKGEEEVPVIEPRPWPSPAYPGTGSPYWYGPSTTLPSITCNGSSTTTVLNGGTAFPSTLTVN